MKLLFDQNISPKIIKHLHEHFPLSTQVRFVELENASDEVIIHIRYQQPPMKLFGRKKSQPDSLFPSRALTLKIAPIPENGKALSDQFINIFNQAEGVALDNSVESLTRIDEFLIQCNKRYQVDDMAETIFLAGCYAGQVMVAHAGGKWMDIKDTNLPERINMSPLVMQLPNGNICDPISKAFKCFAHGERDSLSYFYRVFTQPKETAPPNSQPEYHSGYFMGIYTYHYPFPVNPMNILLAALTQFHPEFYPAKMYTAPETWIEINSPDDFSMEKVPDEYWMEKDKSIHIPIHGANGIELSLSDYRNPDVIPSSVTMNWPSVDVIPGFSKLEALLSFLCDELDATFGLISDKETFYSDELYDKRFEIDMSATPITVYWINWFGKAYLETIGNSHIASAHNMLSVKTTQRGQLVSLQKEPFDRKNPQHVINQKNVVEELGI